MVKDLYHLFVYIVVYVFVYTWCNTVPGGLLCGQILFSSLRSVQLEISCTESKLVNWGPPKTIEFQFSKVCWN
jgi:hypothetical protein